MASVLNVAAMLAVFVVVQVITISLRVVAVVWYRRWWIGGPVLVVNWTSDVVRVDVGCFLVTIGHDDISLAVVTDAILGKT